MVCLFFMLFVYTLDIAGTSETKSTPNGVPFFLLFVFTLDIACRYRYRPDLVQFSFRWKENLRFGSVEPSPATVHRTVAFHGSNLSVLDFSKQKNDLSKQVVFCLEVPARFELANNGFADRGLTTWLRYHMEIRNAWLRS